MSQCLSVARVKNGLALQRRARITVRAVIIPPRLLPTSYLIRIRSTVGTVGL